MKFPNLVVKLPQWNWLQRFDRWRLERGILTGRWTQAEIDDQHRRAHEQYLRFPEYFTPESSPYTLSALRFFTDHRGHRHYY